MYNTNTINESPCNFSILINKIKKENMDEIVESAIEKFRIEVKRSITCKYPEEKRRILNEYKEKLLSDRVNDFIYASDNKKYILSSEKEYKNKIIYILNETYDRKIAYIEEVILKNNKYYHKERITTFGFDHEDTIKININNIEIIINNGIEKGYINYKEGIK